jgi:Xaa-Pro aminopeptidase
MTSPSPYPDGVDRSTLELRMGRLRAEMEREQLDAVLAASVPNVVWVTGRSPMAWALYRDIPYWAIVPREGDVQVVVSGMDLASLEGSLDPEAVRPFGRFAYLGDRGPLTGRAATGRSAPGAAADALAAVGRRVGIDDGLAGWAPALCDDDRLELRFVPEVFVRARRRKDADMIARLRAANVAVEQALLAALAQADEGTTERELACVIWRETAAQGAHPLLSVVAFGDRAAIPEPWPSDRPLRPSEPIRFDLGASFAGCHADLARTAVLGEPDPRLTAIHDAILAGEQAAIDACRAGATAADVYEAAMSATRAAGLPEYERVHCGHGIGMEIYEEPLIAPDARVTLEPGMTFCLETPYYELGRLGAQVEDAVLVTDADAERLGHAPMRLLAAGRDDALPARDGLDADVPADR